MGCILNWEKNLPIWRKVISILIDDKKVKLLGYCLLFEHRVDRWSFSATNLYVHDEFHALFIHITTFCQFSTRKISCNHKLLKSRIQLSYPSLSVRLPINSLIHTKLIQRLLQTRFTYSSFMRYWSRHRSSSRNVGLLNIFSSTQTRSCWGKYDFTDSLLKWQLI